MEEIKKYTITSETKNVTYIVKELEDLCLANKLSQDIIQNVSIAADEALTNIIMHTYKDKADGVILVKLSIDEEKLEIKFEDFGEKYIPENIKNEKPKEFILDKLEVGGYGLFLMNEFMDELRFRYDKKNKKNILIMKKYLFF